LIKYLYLTQKLYHQSPFLANLLILFPAFSGNLGAGTHIIDDFEASEIPLDLKAFKRWSISSVPQGQDQLFPEAKFNNNLVSGFNRQNSLVCDRPSLFTQRFINTTIYKG